MGSGSADTAALPRLVIAGGHWGLPMKDRAAWLWRRFRVLPRGAQILSWVTVAFIALGAIGSATGSGTKTKVSAGPTPTASSTTEQLGGSAATATTLAEATTAVSPPTST